MLSCDEFCKAYWAHYISLEKEFTNTLTYISLDADNYSAYSQAYAKLILQIGSEVDVILKIYCKLLKPEFNGNCILNYRRLIMEKKPEFCEQMVSVMNKNITLQPWKNWINEEEESSPYWWTVYNKVKHERTDTGKINSVEKEYYKFANLNYTLSALAGLYQILLYIFHMIANAEQKRILVPLPCSHIFQLVGNIWDTVDFFGDYAFYLDDENHLIMEYGIPY